ncbi:MAG: anti-sigma factor antagonist BldG [Armatimonadaceae bacterium]
MAELQIQTRTQYRVPILDLSGEIDSYNATRLRDTMVELVERGNPDLILNLTSVDYIDSTGLGAMVAGLKRARESDGMVHVICPNPSIYKIFQITSLNKVFAVHEDERAALSLLEAPESASMLPDG